MREGWRQGAAHRREPGPRLNAIFNLKALSRGAPKMKFIFDGSFEGLLTAIFEVFEHRDSSAVLVSRHAYEPGLLDESVEVVTNEAKSKRVWEGLKKKIDKAWQSRFYNTFLSELPQSPQHLLQFARYVLDNPKGAENNYGHPDVPALMRCTSPGRMVELLPMESLCASAPSST